MPVPITIFLAYASEDESLLHKLEQHLSVFKQEKIIDLWHKQMVDPGAEWEREITEYVNSAQIILILISPAFLSSEYSSSVEMKRVLERHARNEARVIPIILRPVYWQTTPFGKLQALPKFSRPITSSLWANIDEAFFDVVKGLHKTL